MSEWTEAKSKRARELLAAANFCASGQILVCRTLFADAIAEIERRDRVIQAWLTYAESVCDGMPESVLDARLRAALEASKP